MRGLRSVDKPQPSGGAEVILTAIWPSGHALLTVIALVSVIFISGWRRSGSRAGAVADDRRRQPSALQLAIGFVTNFFDTLGIGLFATTTALYKLLGVGLSAAAAFMTMSQLGLFPGGKCR